MSLHFLFGRAGTGKTARCCAEIARYITEAPGRRAYFLVPDQATFRAESMLAAAFPGGGFADVTVCGFTRLSYRVFQELREDTGEALSPLVQQIILRRLLTERRGELRQMWEAARQPHFSAALSSFFHQLDSFRIGEADLRAAAEEEGETPLGRKLADLSLIFSAYHGYLRSHFRYRGSMYDKLAECIPRSRQIREARVWIDGYSGMTPQETAIVSALAAAAEEVTVTLPMDPPEESAGVPLFDRPFRLWETLSGEAGRTDAAVLTEPHRFTCPRVRELADRFFRPFPKACVYPPATRTLPEQGIYITKAPQPAAEADDAARRIALLVRENGFRWRDILVLLRSDDYAELLRRSFETYRIPAFIDKRRPMKNHPLVVLTDSLLRFLAAGEKGPWQGWTKDLLFPLLKTDLLRAFAPEDTDRLENYVLRTGLCRSQWKSVWKFHSPFHLEDDSGMPTPGELEELNRMNRYRQQLLNFLIPLEDGWREAKTVSEKCALLYRWFMEQRVPDTLARWDEMSFAETRERPHLQVWKKVLSLLDDLVRAAGGDEVSGAELLSMAEDGLSSLTFSIIPPTLDHVTVTAIDRGYAMEAKAVFLLGAEEGVFPARIEEGGLLSEEEKRSLRSSRRLIFGPDLMSLIAQEEFYTYLALTRARQALYISWSAAGADGAEHTPSPLLARLAALGYLTAERTAELPGPATEDRSFLVMPDQALALLPAALREGPPAEGSIWQPLRDWALSRKDTARLLAQKAQGFSYRNEAAPLPAAVVRQLFLRGKPFRTSVTRLETYRACPYQYFLRYGLRLDERDRSRMDARDFGSYLHAGLHSFGEFMKKQQRQWRDAGDEEIDAVSRDIAEKVAPRVKSGALLSDAAAQYTKSALDRTFRATSFVELLRRSGYHTIHCGKAHFGAIDTPGEDPHHFGFEVNIAGHAAGGPASYLGEQNYGNRTDGAPQSLFATPGLEKYWGTETFLSEALTREALHALDKARRYGQPFFLYMAHYAVHVPVDRDARFFAKYKERGLSDREAAYAALVEGMDKSLGDLLDWLEHNDELQNTIILFMSDNGGLAAEGTRDGALHTQNAPLNSGKGSAYEGGIREPMLVYWPGVTRGGERCDDYLLIEDFYPTILEMAGIRRYRTVQPIDGRSFVPLLTGRGPNPARGRSLYWNCPNVWGPTGPGIGPTCTIRRGDWKLVYYYEDGRRELFNIRRDIGEREELSASEPRRVRELSRRLGRFLRRVGAQRPSFKATGEPCPWPDEIDTKAPGGR